MSYYLNNASGEVSAQLCATVIRAQNPDVVLLQKIGSPQGRTSLKELAATVGLSAYGADTEGSCAFLSRYPLHNLQTIPLGNGDTCVRADFDPLQERIHLLNLTLSWDPRQRLKQVRKLFGDGILNSSSFPCATIIGGEFGLPLWGCGQVAFNPQIVRAEQPLWRANYPGSFPLWGRGRIYFQGPIRAVSGQVIRSIEAKRASNQLPLVVDVETFDTRRTLKLKEHSGISAKQPKPVCG